MTIFLLTRPQPQVGVLAINRRPSSLKEGKETCTISMNLHWVGRSARPTSKRASRAHRMIGKTQ